MELRVFVEPQQGATYDELLAVALEAERLGYGAFFRSDHFLPMGGVSGLPGPTDAWITLAGIARETHTIRLGTLVTAATFRLPGLFAITVAQVDQMSRGRVELGLGTGWFEAEHLANAVPFPPLGERFDRFEEALQIITGMWDTPVGQTFSFHGKQYDILDSPGLPKPAQQPRVPILIGGGGAKRTPRLAAEYGSEFNIPFRDVAGTSQQFDRVRVACEAAGRDPGSMVFSGAQVLCVGENEAEVARRAASIGREVDELRTNGLAGTPEEVIDKIGTFAAIGAERMYLQVLDLADLDHIRLVADRVMPAVR
jgi:alkanesulfonate monooxygenase